MTAKYFAYEKQPTGSMSPVIYHDGKPGLDGSGRRQSPNGKGPLVARLTEMRPDDPLNLQMLSRLYPLEGFK